MHDELEDLPFPRIRLACLQTNHQAAHVKLFRFNTARAKENIQSIYIYVMHTPSRSRFFWINVFHSQDGRHNRVDEWIILL